VAINWVSMRRNPTRPCADRSCFRPERARDTDRGVRSGRQGEGGKDAGADIVGMEDLAESVKAGKLDFDVVIAAPTRCAWSGNWSDPGTPAELMPNPKVGTVTPDVQRR